MHQGRLVTAFGTVLLLDVLRVFLPSLITLFGQAGATSPELMGAYALAWFLVPLPFVALARRLPPLGVALAAGAALAVGRVGLQFTQGGDPQLYLASALVGLGAVWLVCTAMATAVDGRATGHGVMVGLVAGLAASTAAHTALGTVDLVWREGPAAWVAVFVAPLGLLLTAARAWRATPGDPAPIRPRGWLALGPLLFLAGLYTANSAVAQTIGGTPFAAAALSVVAVLSVLVAANPRRYTPNPLLPLAVLFAILTTLWLAPLLPGEVQGTLPAWSLAALLLGQPALAACAGWAATAGTRAPTRTGLLAASGLLLFVVLVFAFYAAYDLHAPNDHVPFVALAVLAAAILPRATAVRPSPGGGRTLLRTTAVAAALTLAATVVAPIARTGAPSSEAGAEGLRVAAYNVRMGFGMDGRLSVAEQADALRALDADVVALSEVDRGWLLNGGHDGLSMLAERLGMTAYWGPADGPFWGDAVLTSLPVTEVRGHALPASGPTGAQALAVTMEWADTEVSVIATHLQPEGYDLANPSASDQMSALMLVAEETRWTTRAPVVIAGDLNFEPEELPLEGWSGGDYRDAFASVRPFPTMAADTRSDQQIDHILTSDDLVPSDPANPDVPHSDHRPIAVTLSLVGTR